MEGKTLRQKMNLFLDKCVVMGIKPFEFVYWGPEEDDIEEEYTEEEKVCLTKIYVPSNDRAPVVRIPSFVTYLHYSVICENDQLASCKIFIPKECSIEWNYNSGWLTGRKQRFFENAKEIIIEEGHPELSYEDGVLFCFDGFVGEKTLFLYPNNKKDEEYTVPDSVDSIGIDAFFRNKYLRRLNISKNVRTIESCEFNNRTRIEVDADNKRFKSIDGSLYSKNGKILYNIYINEEGNIKIAEGTETIKHSFEDIWLDEKVKEVYIPNSIKPRTGVWVVSCTCEMCERAIVPKELKRYLKFAEKYTEIVYY